MIYLGADHRGFALKEKMKYWLLDWGYEYEDLGAAEVDPQDDYPDYAKAVAEKVVSGTDHRGILICGSGIGVAVAANKVVGVRAGTATNYEQVASAVNDEDLNILALPADFLNEDEAKEITEAFLKAKFSSAERHIRRLNKIKDLEKTYA
ncbi:MAG: RpiB/LacA/LacB family sugar-phosphate isomerase [bacterium]|nr:RpiB/LacA/LacB family sugar-phosphate isomerase [bacterium]